MALWVALKKPLQLKSGRTCQIDPVKIGKKTLKMCMQLYCNVSHRTWCTVPYNSNRTWRTVPYNSNRTLYECKLAPSPLLPDEIVHIVGMGELGEGAPCMSVRLPKRRGAKAYEWMFLPCKKRLGFALTLWRYTCLIFSHWFLHCFSFIKVNALIAEQGSRLLARSFF